MRLHALAFTVLALGACTDDDTTAPPPDDHTLALEMTATIAPGTEVEYCKFVEIPDTWVTHDAIQFTAGSHHVLVYQTPYTTIPTHKEDGTPVDTSQVFDCSDGATNGWRVSKLIGGSQNQTGEAILSFPAGVGLHVGGIALINVHYINALENALETTVKVTWDTVPQDQIATEGDILFLYNPAIAVPPNGTARAHWQCPVYSDITIANIQSHMHARGVGYEARVDSNAPFYTNTKWEGVPVQRYESFTVKAGSKLDYYCDYRNTTSKAVYQGPRTTDEMCMLIGSYYPADPRTANCLDPSGKLPGGDWVGNGTASCGEMLGCVQGANGSFHAITECALAARPEVAHVASEALRCMMGADDPTTECAPQIQACAAQ